MNPYTGANFGFLPDITAPGSSIGTFFVNHLGDGRSSYLLSIGIYDALDAYWFATPQRASQASPETTR